MADAGARKSKADAGGSSRKRRKKNPPPKKKTGAGASANEVKTDAGANDLPNVVELQMKLHRRHVEKTVAHLWDAADAAGAAAGDPIVEFIGTNNTGIKLHKNTGIKLHMNGLLLSGRDGTTRWVAIGVDDVPKWQAYLVSNGYEEWSNIENNKQIKKQAAMNYLLRCMVLGSDESNAAYACITSLEKNINQKWYDEVYDYFKDKSFKNALS